MIVDASALLAIYKIEPEKDLFVEILARADRKLISPVNWHECAINVERTDEFDNFDILVRKLGIVVTPVDEAQARLAYQAWKKFGKGRHPARLNLGDCFAYALAKAMREPLLYKGGDFPHTDIASAV